jgi:hypothetical protein
MDPWMASGYFFLGAGVGALASRLPHAKQIRKLKKMLAVRSNPKTKERVEQLTGRKPAWLGRCRSPCMNESNSSVIRRN